MPDRLLVGVLGHRNSGKSRTWNTLFGRTVRRGVYARALEMRPGESVEVFLISGSFEEREEYAGDILKTRIAELSSAPCSTQTRSDKLLPISWIRSFLFMFNGSIQATATKPQRSIILDWFRGFWRLALPGRFGMGGWTPIPVYRKSASSSTAGLDTGT
jgi:hypothetical protein